jgi:two-component system phosphate regulon response regulator PhoB
MIYLCERKNIAQDRHELLENVLGYSGDVYSRTLDTHMKRLRKKLGARMNCLETIRGIGYRLKIDAENSSL